MKEAEFQRYLVKFKATLKREKTYLIKDDGEKVTAIAAEKEEYIPIFNDYEGPISDKTRKLIDEIQNLQSLNMMLTEQAIAFQKNLMDSIQRNLKQPAGTYSKYQQQPHESAISLFDQKA